MSCFPFAGFVHDEVLDGPYRLVAVDDDDDMSLCVTIGGDRTSCVGDGLPGDTLFAAGADARYVVVARHPRKWPEPPDRTITEYYYIVRVPDEGERTQAGRNVRGPFDEQKFAQEKQRLQLPEFSRVFDLLK